jgi:25S rRNA (uracil2634-N3)-methyltransferase
MAKKGKKSSLREALQRHLASQTRSKSKEPRVAGEKPKTPALTLFKWRTPSVEAASSEYSRTIFSQHIPVITVGDGDGSFSVALHKLGVPLRACTFYDARADVMSKYPEMASTNLPYLTDKQVPVHDKVDARTWDFGKRAVQPRDRAVMVVWNFPHDGHGIADQAHAIRRCQELLLGFFQNVALQKSAPLSDNVLPLVLASRRPPDQCIEEVCSSNSVMQASDKVAYVLVVTVWAGRPYDSWDIKRLASAAHWTCPLSFPFEAARFAGYRHVCTKKLDDPHQLHVVDRPARTHVFVKRE